MAATGEQLRVTLSRTISAMQAGNVGAPVPKRNRLPHRVAGKSRLQEIAAIVDRFGQPRR
jgi:hypothetical protein